MFIVRLTNVIFHLLFSICKRDVTTMLSSTFLSGLFIYIWLWLMQDLPCEHHVKSSVLKKKEKKKYISHQAFIPTKDSYTSSMWCSPRANPCNRMLSWGKMYFICIWSLYMQTIKKVSMQLINWCVIDLQHTKCSLQADLHFTYILPSCSMCFFKNVILILLSHVQ